MKFADLGLSAETLRAVTEAGYDTPTPIQQQAISPVLMMKDIIGIAQTGTGKTASFVLPMIDILAEGRSRARMPRSLILEPTRELAAQVAENFEKYGKYHKLSMALLIGGVSMGDQIKALEKGVDVLIATPGRLMDLFERGKIMLNGCSLLVIDEADRMLDMGFIPDIESICTKLPANRQTLLFSATMPPPIKKLADKFLTNPKYIEVARPATANVNITQRLIKTSARNKRDTLIKLLKAEKVSTAIIFCNRKTTVRDLNKSLKQSGFKSGEIHGDIDQSTRVAELDAFKSGAINLLVASDVAARGLDIKGVSHVFNYDAPWHPDDYVHRIGRTGRAGASGVAYTFVTPADEEAIDNIQKLVGYKVDYLGEGDGGTSNAPIEADANVQPTEVKPEQTPRSPAKRDEARAAAPARQPKPAPEAKREAKAEPKASEAPRAEKGDEKAADKPAEKPERVAKPARDAGKRSDDRPAKPAPIAQTDGTSEDGAWNGPVPSFLGFELNR